jgi:hypothetical protein
MENRPIVEAGTAERELKRRRPFAFLQSEEPVWRDEDHPDIVAMGTAEWVRALRNDEIERQIEIEKQLTEG